ncbi:MAG: DNA-binding protein WhiA [Clostridia bacterium]|nr:DNA-binding protein WhiA [Clostridia bacterium]
MSFASNTRAELARELCADKCCARAELAAALLASGGISFRFGRDPSYALSVTTAEAAVVRHYFQLLKRHFKITAQIRTLRSDSLNGMTRYQLVIPEEDSRLLLDEAGLYDPEAPFGLRAVPPEELVDYACCKKTFLKSAFMISGGMSNPEIAYHIEIAAPTEDFADYVIKNLNYYEIGAKKACRKAKFVVYLKKSDDVSDMLTLMGASQAVLALQNVRIKKDVSNRVNRQLNCDNSNINRTMNTALSQIADIKYIDEQLGLDKLPAPLREIAEVRMNNAATSLGGLGEMLEKPIGKSGVNARLRKISEIADKLRSGENLEL